MQLKKVFGVVIFQYYVNPYTLVATSALVCTYVSGGTHIFPSDLRKFLELSFSVLPIGSHVFTCIQILCVWWATHPSLHADIVWNLASDFEKYVVTFYWAVTTITSVG